MSDKRGAISEMLALFLLALLLRLAWLGVTVTTDEPTWMERSARFGLALLRGNLAETYQSTHPGVTTMWSGAVGLALAYLSGLGEGQNLADFLAKVSEEPSQATLFPFARLLTVLLTSGCVVAVYLLAQRLFGKPVALVGAALLASDPFYLAHSRVLHHDALTTTFLTLSLLSLAVYLWGRGGYAWVAFSGAAAALASLSKLSGSFSMPFVAGTLLLDGLFPLKVPGTFRSARHLRQRLATLVIWGLAAGVTAFAIWPALWTGPFFILKRLVYESFHLVESGHTQFFLGQISTDPGPFFYPVAFLFHATPLNLAGLAFLLLRKWREAGKSRRIFIFLLAYLVLFTIFISLSDKKLDRYILPLFPTLNILAAAGWCGLARLMGRRPGYLLAAGVLIFQMALLLPHYPYPLSYYNPLAGGPQTALKTLTVGWGEGLDLAGRYLARKEGAEDLMVAAVPAQCLAPFFPGLAVNLSYPMALMADYVVLHISQVQRLAPGPDIVRYFQQNWEPEYVGRISGLDYVWVYPGPRFLTYTPPPVAHPGGQVFGGTIRLHGYEVETYPHAGETLHLNLYWQCLAQVGGDYVDYVHLIDEKGHIWSQEDHRPVMELLPTYSWEKGQFIQDKRKLLLPPFMPPGRYRLRIGWYSVGEGKPLPLLDESGAPGGTEAYPGSIYIARPIAPLSPDKLPLGCRLEADLTPELRLLGYDELPQKARPGDKLSFSLYWQAQEDLKKDYQIALWLQDEAGRKRNETLEPPSYPTSAWRRGDLWQDWRDMLICAETPPDEYELWLGLAGDPSEQVRTGLKLGVLKVEGRPRRFEVPPIAHPLPARLEEKVELLGYDLAEKRARPGEALHLKLYWRALAPMGESYTVFTHLLDENERVRGQKDSLPAGGQYPTTGWVAGEVIVDEYEIPVAPDAPPGRYRIEVGMYRAETGVRLKVYNQAGEEIGDRILFGEIKIY